MRTLHWTHCLIFESTFPLPIHYYIYIFKRLVCKKKCKSTNHELYAIICHIKEGRDMSSVYKDNAFVPGFVNLWRHWQLSYKMCVSYEVWHLLCVTSFSANLDKGYMQISHKRWIWIFDLETSHGHRLSDNIIVPLMYGQIINNTCFW